MLLQVILILMSVSNRHARLGGVLIEASNIIFIGILFLFIIFAQKRHLNLNSAYDILKLHYL